MRTFAAYRRNGSKRKESGVTYNTRTPSYATASRVSQIRQILRPHAIQPKLTIGPPNDHYEQEADRVADQVMRMPEPK